MTKLEALARTYAENIECCDCPFAQECDFENGDVFDSDICAEVVLQIIESEVTE